MNFIARRYHERQISELQEEYCGRVQPETIRRDYFTYLHEGFKALLIDVSFRDTGRGYLDAVMEKVDENPLRRAANFFRTVGGEFLNV